MWNERFITFDGEKVCEVLWKDAKIAKWSELNSHISRHVKSMTKLGITSQSSIMSGIIYKHQSQMRRDKPFQYFKKVNGLVKRFDVQMLIDLISSYQTILNKIQHRSAVFSRDISIPSQVFTCFIIERLLGLSKLSVKIISSCQEAFIYLDSHMRLGFFVPFNLFAIASVSRIWMLFKEVWKILKLLFLLLKDVLSSIFNIEDAYPSSLEEWLKDDLSEILPRSKKNEHDEIKLSAFEKSENGRSCDMIKTEEDKEEEEDIMVEDIGEPVSLEKYLDLNKHVKESVSESQLLGTIEKYPEERKTSGDICDGISGPMDEVEHNENVTAPVTKSLLNLLPNVDTVCKTFAGNRPEFGKVQISLTNFVEGVTNRNTETTKNKQRLSITSGSIFLSGRKQKRILNCPICGKHVRTLTSSLSKPFQKTFTAGLFPSSSRKPYLYLTKRDLKSTVHDIKHAMMHSRNIHETRRLILQHRHVQKAITKLHGVDR